MVERLSVEMGFLTLTKCIFKVQMILKKRTFENIEQKGEHAGSLHFLLLLQSAYFLSCYTIR